MHITAKRQVAVQHHCPLRRTRDGEEEVFTLGHFITFHGDILRKRNHGTVVCTSAPYLAVWRDVLWSVAENFPSPHFGSEVLDLDFGEPDYSRHRPSRTCCRNDNLRLCREAYCCKQ